jgi:hypothetical protein
MPLNMVNYFKYFLANFWDILMTPVQIYYISLPSSPQQQQFRVYPALYFSCTNLSRSTGNSVTCYRFDSTFHVKGKGKAYPRTDHERQEGEYRYSSVLSLTSALDGCGWLTPRPGRFTPGKDLVPVL